MIRWGIIGAGKIARRFIKSLAHSDEAILYAIASRHGVEDQFVSNHGDCRIYHAYEALLDDPQVDMVYIALRHSDHFQWAKEALKHGKHVLCEKPATLSKKQTQELCQLAKQQHLIFLEGMKSRFIPLMSDIHKYVEEIGPIEYIETSFCNKVPYEKDSYLFDSKQGGALYDVGIYNIALILDFVDSLLLKIEGNVIKNKGIDVYDCIQLTFENGVKACVECAIDRKKDKTMRIIGKHGMIEATPFYRPTEALVTIDGVTKKCIRPYEYDDFYSEIKQMHQLYKQQRVESVRMTHQDSINCIDIIEKIRESDIW